MDKITTEILIQTLVDHQNKQFNNLAINPTEHSLIIHHSPLIIKKEAPKPETSLFYIRS